MIEVGIGSMIGACIRVFLSQYNGRFPWMTLIINSAGALMLGMLTHMSGWLFFGTGIMGGLTTFSTFSVEAVTLVASDRKSGMTYIALSIILPLTCFTAGLQLID